MRFFKNLHAAKSRVNHRKSLLLNDTLENRQMLTGAAWIGQTGADYVGPWTELKPSNIQDIQLRLNELPLDKSIEKAVIQGFGADRWEFGGPAGSWLVNVIREPNAPIADLYFEPARLESGRQFNVGLTYSDGSFEEIYFQGGLADPSLKPPGQELKAQWLGASAGIDLTSPSARIGPDGVTDLQIGLSQINTNKRLKAIDLVDSDGTWLASYSDNRSRVGTMEFTPSSTDPSRGTLTFSHPVKPLIGPLKVQVRYQDDTLEEVNCPLGSISTTPLQIPASPLITNHSATATWLGQVVTDPTRPGWVRISVANLPVTGVSAWQISEPSGQSWLWTLTGSGSPWPTVYNQRSLNALRDSLSGNWTLEFDSRSDLSGMPLSIMAASDSGRMFGISLTGGLVDPSKRAPFPANSSITAVPGDDLQLLLNQYGTVNLSAGTYNLNQPLVITRPVNLVGQGEAILNFQQPADSPGWSTVVTIAAGNSRLAGFRVQFTGPVKWLNNIRFGPAVIGSPDNYANQIGRFGPLAGVKLENLNLYGPPPSTYLEESPRLIRLVDDASGVITNNRIFGGWVEVTGGPWSITGNNLTGVWPTAFSYDGFAAHDVNGLKFSNNTVQRSDDSGVIFRLIVVNGRSSNIEISDNQSIGLGASISDPWQMQQTNAHEVILTEAYRVNYEGSLYGIDAAQTTVQLGESIGPDYQPGDVLAVLDGPSGGVWRVVMSVINRNTLLLNAPLPQWVGRGTAVSVNSGITNISMTGNLIDQRDRPLSLASVLVGNLYSLNFSANTIIGGFRGLQVIAYPSETPRDWGWTRNVVFDATITRNYFSEILWLNQLGVSHSGAARANYGRLYLTGSFQNNVFGWSSEFLTSQIGQQPGDANLLLPGLEVGQGGPWDDTESRLTVSNNQIVLPDGWSNRPAIWYRSGTINGIKASDQLIILPPVSRPAAPTGLALLNDTGSSQSDKITSDPRLKFSATAGISYQFRTNSNSNWQILATPGSIAPMGLIDGVNLVELRGIDRFGQTGAVASIVFQLDTTAPVPVSSLVLAAFDTVSWSVSPSIDITSQSITFKNSQFSNFYSVSSTTTRLTPENWISGTNTIEIEAIDTAGNRSAAIAASFNYVASGTWGGQDGSDFASLSRTLLPDGKQDIRFDIKGLPAGKSLNSLTVSGFGGGAWAWPTAPSGSYAAAWKPASSGRAGSIYLQSNRLETGRPFLITLKFSDGSTSSFWVTGGRANPNLPASGSSGLGAARLSTTNNKSNSVAKTVLKKPVPKSPVRSLKFLPR
jgi:hypothetical protein